MASPADILRWARASRASYNLEDPGVLFAELGLEVEARITVGDVSAFAVGDDEVLGIVGPGTDSLPNVLRDAEFRLVAFEAPRLAGACKVHAGLLGWWEAVRPWAIAVAVRGRKVVLTGHSAFAAAMTLAAGELEADQLITFGSPRVGDNAFSLQLEVLPMEVVRVVHALDLVPTVPSIGYRHVGMALCLDDQGEAQTAPEDLPEHAMRTGRQLLADLDGEALRRHHIDGYVGACAAFASAPAD